MSLFTLINAKLHDKKSCKPTFYNVRGLLDEQFSDVIVTVSLPQHAPKSFKLHSNVLAGKTLCSPCIQIHSFIYFIHISGCSTVFHDILVDQKQHTNNITIDYTDMTAAEFELIIVYMYTGRMCFNTVEEVCLRSVCS